MHLLESTSDTNSRLKGIVTIDEAVELCKKGEHDLSSVIVSDVYTTSPTTPISDLLTAAIRTRYPTAIIDADGVFQGAVSRAAIIAEVSKGNGDSPMPVTLSELQEE